METLRTYSHLTVDLSILLCKYEHAILQEGILPDDEKRENIAYQKELEKEIEHVRLLIDNILK